MLQYVVGVAEIFASSTGCVDSGADASSIYSTI